MAVREETGKRDPNRAPKPIRLRARVLLIANQLLSRCAFQLAQTIEEPGSGPTANRQAHGPLPDEEWRKTFDLAFRVIKDMLKLDLEQAALRLKVKTNSTDELYSQITDDQLRQELERLVREKADEHLAQLKGGEIAH
jgi:hypothetical protein